MLPLPGPQANSTRHMRHSALSLALVDDSRPQRRQRSQSGTPAPCAAGKGSPSANRAGRIGGCGRCRLAGAGDLLHHVNDAGRVGAEIREDEHQRLFGLPNRGALHGHHGQHRQDARQDRLPRHRSNGNAEPREPRKHHVRRQATATWGVRNCTMVSSWSLNATLCGANLTLPARRFRPVHAGSGQSARRPW